jgi:flagellar biosynthesis/type III secretory pathway ATPase
MWMKGEAGSELENLIEQAVKSATLSRSVLVDAVKEAASAKAGLQVQTKAQDAAMTG